MMLLTGLVVGQLSALRPGPARISYPADRDSAATAGMFYEAVNEFLRTGERSMLLSLLAPGFVDHPAHASGGQSATDFLDDLGSMRAVFPGLQLEVAIVSAQRDTAVVDVRIAGQTGGSFADMEFDAGGEQGFEVLMFEGERILEHWASREMPPLYEHVVTAEIPVGSSMIPDPAIERLTFEPGGTISFLDRDGYLLVAEMGDLSIWVASVPERDIHSPWIASGSIDLPAGGELGTLQTDQALVARPGTHLRLANYSDSAVTALLVSVRPEDFGLAGGDHYVVFQSTGMSRQTIASGPPLDSRLEHGRLTVTVGRAELPAGASIPGHYTGVAELVTVDMGTIEAMVPVGGAIWVQPGKSFVTIDDRQSIGAGQGVRADTGATVEYRAADSAPATIWIATVRFLEDEDIGSLDIVHGNRTTIAGLRHAGAAKETR